MKLNLEKIQIYTINFLRLTVLLAIAGAIIEARWVLLFSTTIVFLLTFLPYFFEKKTNVLLPVKFEFIIVLFIYASLFLGELNAYYTKFWWWDVVLHTSSGIALGFAGFLLLYTLYYQKKVEAGPFWIALFAFCFSVAIGVVWEIFEFFMDSHFGFNMQKSGLRDTMWDLIVDSTGALLTSVVGYFYIKTGKGFLFGNFFRKFALKNSLKKI